MTTPVHIPFNRATWVGNEMAYLTQVVERGQLAGNGPWTNAAEQLLQEALSMNPTLLTTSCTSALEVIALSLGLNSGDEVIVPSFTYVSSAAAFSAHGARPVFVDIRPDTLNINEQMISAAITQRTKAICVTHYGGVACNMDVIGPLAAEHGIVVVEDNAHGLFGSYRGVPLGSIGDFGALSFHATKNFTSGQGGALVVNRPASLENVRMIRENGTNRSAFERGEVSAYTWTTQGINALPSELIAAVVLAQLEQRIKVQERRSHLWNSYQSQLAHWASEHGIEMPTVPPECESSHHLFYLILSDQSCRERFITHLSNRGITAVSHYEPLHNSPVGSRFGAKHGQCPVAEDRARRLVRLPLFYDLSNDEQAVVVDVVISFNSF